MLVSSVSLLKAADQIAGKVTPQEIPSEPGVFVTESQLRTAAALLQAAEPSVITSARGPAKVTLNDPQERPGWIDADEQGDRDILTFSIGIIPKDTYRIALTGDVIE